MRNWKENFIEKNDDHEVSLPSSHAVGYYNITQYIGTPARQHAPK